jgi:TRAP transporter TAXI family solute receptor
LLRSGRFDIGIVPSDVLADAVAGQGPFAAWGPATDLRVLFAGHADVFTLVAHQGSGIRTVADLRGKRIGIGSPGSRQRANMERVMAALGLTRNDFADVRELSPAEQNRAFCANELDAIVYSVGHPNGLIRDATLTCDGMLVAVSGPAIDRTLSEYQEYERATIPGGTYPFNPADVHTFGVRAVVVTTARMPDAVAYEITKAVFDDFDDFRRLHPAFEALSVAGMAHAAGRAPVHAGAVRYYREHGWLP